MSNGSLHEFNEWKKSKFTKLRNLKTNKVAYRLECSTHRVQCEGCLGCLFTDKELENFYESNKDTSHVPTIFLHGHSELPEKDIVEMIK